MDQKTFVKNIVIALVIILVGALGYMALIKKPATIEQPQTKNTQNSQTTATSADTNTASKKSPITSPSLPTTCVDEAHSPGGKDLPPVITSISPTSGPAGAKVEIRGCNLAGFEGDQMVIFERSDGKKLTFYGAGYDEKMMTITIGDYCPTGSETGRYSGITSPCETINALPGIYKVYVITWGEDFKSNIAEFTVK